MGFDIKNYKKEVETHVEKLEKNKDYSITMLNKKLNNYCLAVKGDLQYKFYEFMLDNSYDKDEIKQHENQVQEIVNMLSFRTEYSDKSADLKFLDEFKFNLNHYVNEYITITNPFEFSEIKDKTINNLNKKFSKDCNNVVKRLTKSCKKDMLESLTNSFYDIINAQAFEKNKYKSVIEDMIEQIERYIIESYNNEKREQIVTNSKKYLNNIIKVYLKKIDVMESESAKAKVDIKEKSNFDEDNLSVVEKSIKDTFNNETNEDLDDLNVDYFQNVSWQNKILKSESATNIIVETTENRKIVINEYNLSEVKSLDDDLYNDIKERLSYILELI